MLKYDNCRKYILIYDYCRIYLFSIPISSHKLTMKDPATYEPTESELEILQILWANEPATVRFVYEEIKKKRYGWLYHDFKANAAIERKEDCTTRITGQDSLLQCCTTASRSPKELVPKIFEYCL